MQKHLSYYKQAFKLHGENCHLRTKLASWESGEEIRKIRQDYEIQQRKDALTVQNLKVESSHYHDLWQKAVRLCHRMTFCSDADLLADLRKENTMLQATIKSLTEQLQEARDSIAKLKAQLNRDYENSSIPSSQKPFHKKIRNSRERTDRKAGGQPGHAGFRRPQLEPTRPALVIPVPKTILDDPDYYLTGKMITKQVADLDISVKVISFTTPEYRSRTTGKTGHAAFPDGIANEFNYGPKAKALAFLLNNYCNVSIDKTREIIEGISDGKILLSKGLIAGLSHRFSDATSEERQKIYQHLLMAPVMYSDITPGRVNGKTVQVLVCANENELLYFFRRHKGLKDFADTPVAEYQQTLVHDHERSFYHFGSAHQECIAHVLRYLEDSIENESSLTWNKKMKVFLSSVIHEVKSRRKDLSEEEISAFEKQYSSILSTGEAEYKEHPPNRYYPEGMNLMKRMKKYKNSYLLFLRRPEVDYTNNISERGCENLRESKSRQLPFAVKTA